MCCALIILEKRLTNELDKFSTISNTARNSIHWIKANKLYRLVMVVGDVTHMDTLCYSVADCRYYTTYYVVD